MDKIEANKKSAGGGTGTARIPKVIHYCWFGGNEKPELIRKCMESWKTFCPDYEIVEWNEDNFDINCCQYVADAYAAKKWAFVSDYARLWVVYHHGGIYLDTDVELRSSLDDLLQYDAWFAQDDVRYIATGLGFGAHRDNEILYELMRIRGEGIFDEQINTYLDTPVFRRMLQYSYMEKSQLIEGTMVVGINDYSKYATHHYTESWRDPAEHEQTQKYVKRYWKLMKFLRNPQFLAFLEEHCSGPINKVYIFIAYDLFSSGPMYFIKRWVGRIFHKKQK